jgi:hypothetical protein
MVAIWEPHAPDGAIWGPYGSRMGAMCTLWEADAPDGSCVQNMGVTCCGWHHIGATCARWELHAPYGSHIHQMGGGLHHMGAEHDIWGAFGSCVCRVGAGCAILDTRWFHMGAACAIQWPYGNCVCYMGAVRTIWELHAPYVSYMCHIGATCTVWEPHAMYESDLGGMNQVCTLRTNCDPYGCHMAPYGRWLVSCGSHMYHIGST